MSSWASDVEVVTIGCGEDLPQLLPTARIAHMRQAEHALRDLSERLLEAHQMPKTRHQPYLLQCASALDADLAWEFADVIDKAGTVPVALAVQVTTALKVSGQRPRPAEGPWQEVPDEPDSRQRPQRLAPEEPTTLTGDTATRRSPAEAADISAEIFPALLASSTDRQPGSGLLTGDRDRATHQRPAQRLRCGSAGMAFSFDVGHRDPCTRLSYESAYWSADGPVLLAWSMFGAVVSHGSLRPVDLWRPECDADSPERTVGGLSMSTQDMVTVSVAVLVPVVTAAAGVVSLRAQDRRVRRSRAGRRRLAFEDATRQVAFATEWWKAKQLIAGTPEALQNPTAVANGWLDEASARVSAAEQAETDEESHVSVSRLLLFHRFHRRSAKAIRIGFYAALGFMTSVITVVMNDAESRKDVGFNVWILASSGILALFLRFWAVSADSPDQR